MRRPKGSYLKLTVPPLPGRVTLVRRFSKSQVYCVVPVLSVLLVVLPLESSLLGHPDYDRLDYLPLTPLLAKKYEIPRAALPPPSVPQIGHCFVTFGAKANPRERNDS